nr:DEAD/DEAH box helicase [uncultured Aminipila sp.]
MEDILAKEITQAMITGIIDKNQDSLEEFRPRLLFNDTSRANTVLSNLTKELDQCESFWFSVAFITKSGLIVLKETLKKLCERGIKGRILTTDYLAFNEPDALRELLRFSNLDVKVFTEEHFHTKGYMFKKGNIYTLVVGSSNLTQNALKTNKEWNLKITSLNQGELIEQTISEFELMWTQANVLTEEWIKQYEKVYLENKINRAKYKISRIRNYKLEPNSMQKEAIKALAQLRQEGKDKALLISATGTGKTYLSAFDVRNFKPKKMLFLVHREQILKQAEESFKDVLGEQIKAGFLSGNIKDTNADYLFATTNMMAKTEIREQFAPNYFDYIVIDEIHKAGAKSYQNIIEYFSPKFLLGMTATPERTDGFDIYKLFDHNIAYEIRLQQAMEADLLCPFHYFGITELSVNGEVIDDGEFEKVFPYLISKERVKNIIEKINYYGYSGTRVKGLMFCRDVREAKALSDVFNERGFRTVALSGNDSQESRENAIERLEKKSGSDCLDYIFTVDIFNEGVDIPQVNQVVMLRPTQSSIIFVQQLGRGLRKSDEKEYVVVIDFIGNYTKNFLIPIALSGDRTFNKDTIRKYVAEGNRIIPGCSTINFDQIAQKRIFESIDTANFNDVRLIKESYQNLKAQLGRIPTLQDFEKSGAIDVTRIFDNSSLGSYYMFLVKYEKEYKVRLNNTQEKCVEFISKKLASGKRAHELELLKRIIRYKKGFMDKFKEYMLVDYKINISKTTETNLVNVLRNEFPTGTGKATYEECIFIKEENGEYKISKVFDEILKDQQFHRIVMELIEFGIERNKKLYGNRYKNTNFQLYQKYTYEEVCRLLDWEKAEVALNIGGYKFDKKTKTYPVFINYEKSEDISASINYEDRFINPSALIALSKSGKTSESDDVVTAYHAKELGVDMELFVRKNKDDKISKEFYYLGRINTIGRPNPIIMQGINKKAVEIRYQLETPVREDIYEYITK